MLLGSEERDTGILTKWLTYDSVSLKLVQLNLNKRSFNTPNKTCAMPPAAPANKSLTVCAKPLTSDSTASTTTIVFQCWRSVKDGYDSVDRAIGNASFERRVIEGESDQKKTFSTTKDVVQGPCMQERNITPMT